MIQTVKVDEDIRAYAKGIFGCLGNLIRSMGGVAKIIIVRGGVMSGGHFDYRDHSVRELVIDVAHDLKKDSKILAKTVKEVGTWLTDLIHELDYHYAADTEIDDFRKTETKYLRKLESITAKYVDKHYE